MIKQPSIQNDNNRIFFRADNSEKYLIMDENHKDNIAVVKKSKS